MKELPDEVIIKILLYCLIFKVENSVKNILNLKLVCKKFNVFLKDTNLWTKLYTNYNAENIYKKYNFIKNLSIEPLIKFNYMVFNTPKELSKIFTNETLFFIPEVNYYIGNIQSWHYDNIDVNIFNKKIMRGYSRNGTLYLAFRYSSYVENKIKIEIIYNYSQSDRTLWTTCGSGSCITNSIFLQSKFITSNNLYLFNNFTINYIKRLIKGKAGNVYYDDLGYREDTIDLLKLEDA